MLVTKSDIANGEGRDIQDKTPLPGHESGEEFTSVSDIYQFPKPAKRQRINDTKHIKNRSKTQERELARSYRSVGFEKAKRIAGSGAWGEIVADVDPGEWFLVEAKETSKGNFTTKRDVIQKIAHQAKQMGRPWWVIHEWIGEASGPYEKVVVMSEKHFFELMNLLKERE